MRTLVSLAVALTLMAGTCNEGKDGGGTPGNALARLVGSKWVLQTLNGAPIDQSLGERTPYLQLAEGDKVSGMGGCNQLFGSFTVDGTALKFGELGATKMYCQDTMELEGKFTSALRATGGYSLDGDVLRLMQGDRELAVLRAQ
ncbi:MAG: META domain-containing protein [Flavobacteriales bacterium]|nr:META domain-containing protein [Flavobacteriales bacterium]